MTWTVVIFVVEFTYWPGFNTIVFLSNFREISFLELNSLFTNYKKKP